MHPSNFRLLFLVAITWYFWGGPFQLYVCTFALGFFIVWYFWSATGMSLRRKLQLATWGEPVDGCIKAKISLPCGKVLDFIEKKRKETGKHITITHVIAKAVGNILKGAPGLNGRIVLDRFIPHKTVDLSVLTTVEGGKNLSKVKICDVDKKSVEDICQVLEDGATKLRTGKDENFKKSMGPIKLLPTFIIRILTTVFGYLSGSCGIDIAGLGVEAYPFGGAIITNVGMFGIGEAYAPFTPFARVPMLVLIGSIQDGVVIVDGEVTVQKKIKMTVTLDHRYIDGAQGKVMTKCITEAFENPESLEM